jgi:hypothetical protein
MARLDASKRKISWHSLRSKYKNKLHLYPYGLSRNVSIDFRGHFDAIFPVQRTFMTKLHLTVLIKSAVSSLSITTELELIISCSPSISGFIEDNREVTKDNKGL